MPFWLPLMVLMAPVLKLPFASLQVPAVDLLKLTQTEGQVWLTFYNLVVR